MNIESWHDAKHDENLLFDKNLNGIDLHLRSQCYEKSGICAVILL